MMSTTIRRHALAAACLGLAAGAAPHALAASTWNFQQPGQCAQAAANANNFGNSWTCSPGALDPTLTASGWSDTGAGSTYAVANLDDNGASGFGVKNQVEGLNVTAPNHALDNSTSNDMMLLGFSSSVVLKSLTLGYYNTDSDVTVLRYTGTSAPVLGGLTSSNLLSNGWSLVGSYADIGTSTKTLGNNAGSSWWLISAYNATFGGSGAGLSAGNDYLKVLAVAGDKVVSAGVSEPGALALAAVALGGLGWTRRRRPAVGATAA